MSKRRLLLAILLTVLSLACTTPEAHSGEGYSWEFEDNGEDYPWKVFNNAASRDFSGGNLNLHGGDSPHIAQFSIPPVPSSSTILIKIKSEESFTLDLITRKASEKLSYLKSYSHKGSEEFQEYRFYLNEIIEEGRVSAIGIRFNVSNAEISIASIKLYETTFTEDLISFWNLLWSPFERYMSTINRIESPRAKPLPFIAIIGIITLLIFSASMLVALVRGGKGRNTRRTLLNSVAVSFITGGLIFSVRMDYNWLYLLKDDLTTLAGRPVEERISKIYREGFDDFFGFLDLIRETLPEGEATRPAEKGFMNFYAQLGRYYLLPIKSSGGARYLWTYNDKGVKYDRLAMTLTKNGGVIASPVILVAGESAKKGVFLILGDKDAADAVREDE